MCKTSYVTDNPEDSFRGKAVKGLRGRGSEGIKRESWLFTRTEGLKFRYGFYIIVQ